MTRLPFKWVPLILPTPFRQEYYRVAQEGRISPCSYQWRHMEEILLYLQAAKHDACLQAPKRLPGPACWRQRHMELVRTRGMSPRLSALPGKSQVGCYP